MQWLDFTDRNLYYEFEVSGLIKSTDVSDVFAMQIFLFVHWQSQFASLFDFLHTTALTLNCLLL